MKNLSNFQEIDAQTALLFVDDLFGSTTGRRLNDLERIVFLGSWAGKTYEEMYPASPQYIEKSVGYKLWQKLSTVLGEKVGKKRIRGVVMRHYIDNLQAKAITTIGDHENARCVIIYPSNAPSNHQAMVQTLSQCLRELGCQVHCRNDEEESAVKEFHANVDYVIRVSPAD
jgi:hypothetical protein